MKRGRRTDKEILTRKRSRKKRSKGRRTVELHRWHG
jgi:hypothetical protein